MSRSTMTTSRSLPARLCGPMVRVSATALGLFASAPGALAQQPRISFSIDWKGPTIGQQSSGGGPLITEADVLLSATGIDSFGPLPEPQVLMSGGQLMLQRYSICKGHVGGDPCGIEVDALSYGNDRELVDGSSDFRVWFSVDEFAQGRAPFFGGPNLDTEGPAGDISADLFIDLGLPSGPLPPTMPPVGHVGNVDGDGLRSAGGFVYRGLGIVEPNPPDNNQVNLGDNLDAVNVGGLPSSPLGAQGAPRVFFSLDSAFIDPRTGVPNSGSAQAHGFSGADVLFTDLGAGLPPQVYAPAVELGLDQAGVDSDDLDALILRENGIPGYQRSNVPYDWASAPDVGVATDMLLFSVRAGSAIIGQPDSIWGAAIEPGDLLIPPPGGVGNPGIFFPAEVLGMSTFRSDGMEGADTTAASLFDTEYHDCNGNGRDDSVDIAVGSSTDDNENGIPDECDPPVGIENCFCSSAPCGNVDAGAGCANSTGSGAFLRGLGSNGTGTDDLLLIASGLPTNKLGIFYMGGGTVQTSFGDGQRCVGSGGQGIVRFLPPLNSGPSGTLVQGGGLGATGGITAGETWHFQGWYRDPMGPCGSGFNLTNRLSVHFVP